MRFIHATTKDGRKIAFNYDSLLYFRDENGITFICLEDGESFYIKETFEALTATVERLK